MDKIQDTVENITTAIEQQLDDEINRLENLKFSDFEKIREERLKALKKQDEEKRKWLATGHGVYSELPEEKALFDVTKNSSRVVCHFYRDGTMRCKIVDKHLKILAPKHLETRFVSLNAEKCPFLTETQTLNKNEDFGNEILLDFDKGSLATETYDKKLKVVVIPTLLMFVDQICVDRIIGFTDLGNRDDFETNILEWRLAVGKVIHYDGDLTEPPRANEKKKTTFITKKTIREKDSDDSDLSDE